MNEILRGHQYPHRDIFAAVHQAIRPEIARNAEIKSSRRVYPAALQYIESQNDQLRPASTTQDSAIAYSACHFRIEE